MQLIGLLGGMGWKTTATYYRMINEFAQKELGSEHTARILLHSVNFRDIRHSRNTGDWDTLSSLLTRAGNSLKGGGADFIVMASNSMHEFADHISLTSGLDLLHITDPTGSEIQKDGFHDVALLGTRATMEGNFYAERLLNNHGINVITPEPDERIEVDRVINQELDHGIVSGGSRTYLGDLIQNLRQRGAEAVVLGCSELSYIVPPDSDIKHVYDTTRLHAAAATRRALGVLHD